MPETLLTIKKKLKKLMDRIRDLKKLKSNISDIPQVGELEKNLRLISKKLQEIQIDSNLDIAGIKEIEKIMELSHELMKIVSSLAWEKQRKINEEFYRGLQEKEYVRVVNEINELHKISMKFAQEYEKYSKEMLLSLTLNNLLAEQSKLSEQRNAAIKELSQLQERAEVIRGHMRQTHQEGHEEFVKLCRGFGISDHESEEIWHKSEQEVDLEQKKSGQIYSDKERYSKVMSLSSDRAVELLKTKGDAIQKEAEREGLDPAEKKRLLAEKALLDGKKNELEAELQKIREKSKEAFNADEKELKSINEDIAKKAQEVKDIDTQLERVKEQIESCDPTPSEKEQVASDSHSDEVEIIDAEELVAEDVLKSRPSWINHSTHEPNTAPLKAEEKQVAEKVEEVIEEEVIEVGNDNSSQEEQKGPSP